MRISKLLAVAAPAAVLLTGAVAADAKTMFVYMFDNCTNWYVDRTESQSFGGILVAEGQCATSSGVPLVTVTSLGATNPATSNHNNNCGGSADRHRIRLMRGATELAGWTAWQTTWANQQSVQRSSSSDWGKPNVPSCNAGGSVTSLIATSDGDT
jgi:hypothetical protein